MFSSLFGNLNANNISINMNFDQNPIVQKQMQMMQMMNNPQLQNNMNRPMELGYKEIIVEDDPVDIKFDFGRYKISSNYKLIKNDDIEYHHRGDYSSNDNMLIIMRRSPLPPLLYLMDFNIDDNFDISDGLDYITNKCADIGKLFLIIEESGSVEEGEPFMCEVDSTKALFRRTIYSISL